MSAYELKETLVKIENVSLKFGDKTILRPINVEVRDVVRPDKTQGQVVGILGPSGIGKSQLSRIIAGLQQPTTGKVTLNGRVGFVFQNYPLFNHRTVMSNLMVALEDSPLSKKDRRDKVLEYLTKFDLSDRAEHFPAQLSGGQRQRASIIQMLLNSQHFLVMDEPFTGLDPLMKDKVCDLIEQVASLDEKNTIFVVAHDISALVSIADTLWLMGRERDADGQIVPGAFVKVQYNLIDLDLAWQPNISTMPRFHAFVDEIKGQFRLL